MNSIKEISITQNIHLYDISSDMLIRVRSKPLDKKHINEFESLFTAELCFPFYIVKHYNFTPESTVHEKFSSRL